MKKTVSIASIVISMGFVFAVQAPSMTLYDDFSGTSIDKTKWRQTEFVREIDVVSQELLMKLASLKPITGTAFPYTTYNRLAYSDPNSVTRPPAKPEA